MWRLSRTYRKLYDGGIVRSTGCRVRLSSWKVSWKGTDVQREGRMMIIEGKDTEDENEFRVRDLGCNVSGLGYVLSVNDVCI
jgi:hypothetical protein